MVCLFFPLGLAIEEGDAVAAAPAVAEESADLQQHLRDSVMVRL